MKSLRFIAALSLLLGFVGTAAAAKPLTRLDEAIKSNTEAADALASAPENVRQAAMEAALYPDTLSDLKQRQGHSQDQFQKLISSYSRKTQEQVYEVSRYPNLVSDLVEGGKKSKDQIKDLSKSYPRRTQDAAQDLGRKDYELLRSVRDLYGGTDRDFANSLNSLPSSAQSAYRTLLNQPELLNTLGDNLDFTSALGAAYRADPSGTRARIDELNHAVGQQKEEALDDYRQTLQSDPQAREELQRSAKAFANEYGYEDYDDDYRGYGGYSSYSNPQTVISFNISPYPYWFGYPYWYASPFWRPYPLWWYTGFWGWGPSFYVWGFPSFYYTSWFYGYPHHFYYYPHLAGCYAGYYNHWGHHPYYYSGFHRAVNNWQTRYGNQITSDMWRRDRYSADRWRQFGQTEDARRRQVGSASAASAFNGPMWKDPQQTRSRARLNDPNAASFRPTGASANGASDGRAALRSRDQGKVFSAQQGRQPQVTTTEANPSARSRVRDVSPDTAQPTRSRASYSPSRNFSSTPSDGGPEVSYTGHSRPRMDSTGFSSGGNSNRSSFSGGSSSGFSHSSGGFGGGGFGGGGFRGGGFGGGGFGGGGGGFGGGGRSRR